MGKRSDGQFERIPKDKYDTPRSAVLPLLPHLAPGTTFAEPCAGVGQLMDILEGFGHKCTWATDIEPRRADIGCLNAMALPLIGRRNIHAQMIISNLPWTRAIMHPLIDRLSAMMPCFFLFDSDWHDTKQSRELIWRCSRIIPVGRVKWIPGSEHVGMDNVSWFEFLPGHTEGPRFIPIGAPVPVRATVAEPAALVQTPDDVGAVFMTPPELGAPQAAPADPGPDATSLLAKLRKGAGHMAGIPRLTSDIAED